MEKRELICIGCPMGCRMTVTMEQSQVTQVSGNTCRRGEAYARREVTNPTRIVTSTVRVKALQELVVEAPVRIGEVLLSDVAGTGVDIVATRACPQAV